MLPKSWPGAVVVVLKLGSYSSKVGKRGDSGIGVLRWSCSVSVYLTSSDLHFEVLDHDFDNLRLSITVGNVLARKQNEEGITGHNTNLHNAIRLTRKTTTWQDTSILRTPLHTHHV